jgi:hypothetical protein
MERFDRLFPRSRGIRFCVIRAVQQIKREKYKYAAEQAFSYENYWYSDEYENWPDFRQALHGTE